MSPGWRLRGWQLAALVLAVVLVVVVVKHHLLTLTTLFFFVSAVVSIIIHEVSHGVAALACGDDTAKRAGRLTANPLAHIDPVGTIIVPAVLTFLGLPVLAWAKPVPVNVSRLRHPRNQAVLVALVGPFVNFALTGLAVLLLRLGGVTISGAPSGIEIFSLPGWAANLLFIFGAENVILGIFNLIPLPPLDGSAVLERLLPASLYPVYLQIRPYTLLIVLAVVLLAGGALDRIFQPFLALYERML